MEDASEEGHSLDELDPRIIDSEPNATPMKELKTFSANPEDPSQIQGSIAIILTSIPPVPPHRQKRRALNSEWCETLKDEVDKLSCSGFSIPKLQGIVTGYVFRSLRRYRSEVLSVVIRPSNQLKITFLEAKDIADLGSLKEAAKIFVPGGATLYSARTIKIKEEEGYRNYYFYEFGNNIQHVALLAAVNSGKVFIAGATAPHNKWNDDGVRLRSAAVSLIVL
ncbi:uncharacterized protein LOC111381317 [Olea europaea var. sylvestris]|uniref:uncharacterized protein LOC111381317 n=1 Tax=Olea europaea var. sylvestris TaxID=158386 RepID=UPI000C1CF096|nr:uncharacterized protein LOC111381317 [Olea europaea var. sylvestris]